MTSEPHEACHLVPRSELRLTQFPILALSGSLIGRDASESVRAWRADECWFVREYLRDDAVHR